MVDKRKTSKAAAFFLLGWCKEHTLKCDKLITECDTCQGYVKAIQHGNEYPMEA